MYENHTTLVTEKACLKWNLNISDESKVLKRWKSGEFKLTDIRKSCFFIYRRNSDGPYYDVYLEYCEEFQNCLSKVYMITSGEKVELPASDAWSQKTYEYGKYYYNYFREPKGEGNAKEFCLEITYIKNVYVEKPLSQKMIPTSYEKLWKNQELCDIEFLINEEKIKAHTVVLAAASPYFFAMFNNNDTVENINRVVDLSKDSDVTPENFQGFLEFVYGCKSIDDLSSIVHDLLVLADKYNVDQLHQACQNYMSNNITEENVIKVLLLSDKYNGKTLKKKAIDFAKANIATVKNSDDFDALCDRQHYCLKTNINMEHSNKARTTLRQINARFEWVVENPSARSYISYFKSPLFKFPEIDEYCWFSYSGSDVQKILTVTIGHSEVLMQSVGKVYGINSNLEKIAFNFHNSRIERECLYEGTSKCLKRQRIIVNDYINEQNRHWVFVYEITYALASSDHIEQSNKSMILAGYDQLYKNQKLCDIVFVIEGKQIKAHLVTLAAASSYFHAMFKHESMIESQNRVVDLRKDNDVTLENFQGLLYYIYGCKRIDEMSDIVHELLILADKFDVKQLHEACESHLSDNITKENITEILILSDKYNCELLKKEAIKFAKNNVDAVKASKEFETICKITDLMRSLI